VSRLALYLLGPPRIERDGVPIKLDRRKAIALLAYIAVTEQNQRRAALVNLLWPEYDSTRGRSALRRTLYALNNALAGAWLEVDREEIGLNPGADLWLDVEQFQRHLAECETHGHPTSQACSACLAPLTDAVALVRGDFMSGFSLKDSFNFDDWQLFQAEALRRELTGALERLVRWHSAQREFKPALGYARRRLALDPLDEAAHRQLMRLYIWSGQRSAALSQYEECVAVLEDQLGVSPQETTSELYSAIKAGHAPLLPVDERLEPAEESHERLPDLPAEPSSFLEEEEPHEWPAFFARERELAHLDRFLEPALAGQGRVAFVTGEAGSGKTALVQEFVRRAQEVHADLLVASGNCNAHTGIGDPYLPLREILGLLTGDVQARWAAGAITREHARRLWNALPLAAQTLVEAGPDLIGTFVPRTALLERAMTGAPSSTDWLIRLGEPVERKPVGPVVPSPQQSHLFEQYTRVVQALACQAPLVLVLDDLQWADLGSISLLFHLGRKLAGSRILIVGAYRPEEVALGRDGARHPLTPVVNEFRRLFGDVMVNVDQAEHRGFVEAVLDSEPNRLGVPFRQMLYRQTHGHPLSTIELLRGMQERGDLVQDREGRWVEGPALDWEMLPARVEAAIAERIGRLPEPLQAALRVASVEGEDFTAEVVARVLETDGRKMVKRLSSELDRRHRLVRAQAIERLGSRRVSRYRFRHYLFQKYLYDTLDEVERAYLHEDVGNALEELHGVQASERAATAGTAVGHVAVTAATAATAAVAVQLAWHFQEAGIPEKAIHYLHQAGERAAQLSAFQEGIAHMTRALELLVALPDLGDAEARLERAQQELDLQLSLGRAYMGGDDRPIPRMIRAYTRARELCQQMGKTSELSGIVGQLATAHFVRAEHHRARALGDEALRLAQQTGDPLLVALGHWRLGYVLFALGEFSEARAHLESMLAFYEPQHHHPLVLLSGSDAGVSALAYDACCLWCLGYPEQALSKSQEAMALARALDHPFSLAEIIFLAGCLFHAMHRDAQAIRDDAEELARLAGEKLMPTWLGGAVRCRGEALAMLGQVQEGMAQMREGMAIHQSVHVGFWFPGTLCALAEAQAKAGNPQEGLATLAEALDLVEQTGERCWEAELHRLRGELLLIQGNEADAEASLQHAIEIARRQQARSWELRATTSLARLWQAQGRTDEARQTLSGVFGWFTEGFDTADLREATALLEQLS
jgi:predicted ATPase/DNA-binding SARP family transcriptional activator